MDMIITEPKWKKLIVETTGPIFTPKLCQELIDLNKTLDKKKGQILRPDENKLDLKIRKSTISFIPFDNMKNVYDDINKLVQKINRNNFGFNNIEMNQEAQITEYKKDDFYSWHTDTGIDMSEEPPVRKLSMTVLLNDPSEFEGGDLQFANRNINSMKQGHAAIFASFLQHQITPITKGVRRSLVMWFGGEPFK
jgi:PKHD-type hydroxylase|tara:strand:+ start:38 stop:619 length:582 start_codon:yes stop_codon:yes gene_type:complete